ncbi:MAG: 30S ribosomal protein S5 [Candidatus Aenigmatarchaeota archaeon]
MTKRVLGEKAQEEKVEMEINADEAAVPQEEKDIEEEAKKEVAGEAVIEAVPAEARPAEPAKLEVSRGDWKPVTSLGKEVAAGTISDIGVIFAEGRKIMEPEIVDILLPDLGNDVILIGGSTGKGGGIRRTSFRRTSRMHKSGRRYRISVLSVAGNSDGYIGLGLAKGPPGRHREVMEKSLRKAKLNIVPIRRGCGSWECNCGGAHSIPFAVKGKSGSVKIELLPAPKGVGLCVCNEMKKIMRLAGIKDVWCKTRGSSKTRVNLVKAVFNALKELNTYKVQGRYEKIVGVNLGKKRIE